jgi:hypothetical protein
MSAETLWPVMFMHSEDWALTRDDNNTLIAEYISHTNNAYFQLTILGSNHQDFTLVPLFSPLAAELGFKGPITGERVLEIVNVYSLAFFNEFLQHDHTPLLRDSAPRNYPEAKFAAYWPNR